jgi:hypothetical protein
MGLLFKNIDDLKIVKSLFPKECEISYDDDPDIYGDGKQAGRAINLYDHTYQLIPRKSTQTLKTIAGEREADCIAWDVHVSIHLPSHDRMEPDDWDDKQLLTEVSFEEAVQAINADMFRCEVNNCLENLYYENDLIDEENEPYA